MKYFRSLCPSCSSEFDPLNGGASEAPDEPDISTYRCPTCGVSLAIRSPAARSVAFGLLYVAALLIAIPVFLIMEKACRGACRDLVPVCIGIGAVLALEGMALLFLFGRGLDRWFVIPAGDLKLLIWRQRIQRAAYTALIVTINVAAAFWVVR